MFDRFDAQLARLTLWLAYAGCVIIFVLFVLTVVDVSMRTLGFNPPEFTLAVVEYGLLYFAMFAAPYLVRQRGHVTIEAVVAALPRPVAQALAKVVYFVCFLVAMIFTYFSVQLVVEALSTMELDMRGVDVPLWLQYTPLPIGFALIGLEFLRYLFGRASYYSYDLGEVKDGM